MAQAGAAASATRRGTQPRPRVARRLRRLALRGLLTQSIAQPRGNLARRCHSWQLLPAMATGNSRSFSAAAGSRPSATAVAHANTPGDGLRLAARALSEALCDEPNAPRFRATVRGARGLRRPSEVTPANRPHS